VGKFSSCVCIHNYMHYMAKSMCTPKHDTQMSLRTFKLKKSWMLIRSALTQAQGPRLLDA